MIEFAIIIFGFFIAMLYANMGEWLVHKYVLHGLGKNKDSFWSYHWFEHHKVCMQNGMFDPGYSKWPRSWNSQFKELFVLSLILILHLPLFYIFPAFVTGLYFSLALYYFRHRRAHLDYEWAKRHLPWHYDHHMTGTIIRKLVHNLAMV